MQDPPQKCKICTDSRQYVPLTGQSWTTLATMRLTHHNYYRRLQPDLYAIATQPKVGIGQRALLVRSPAGNVLWDCIALIDEATVDIVRAFGGLSAIAISHPHYYTTMVEWAREFGCPVWLHEDDREWVMRDATSIHYWSGDTARIGGDMTLIRLGGHFKGGTVLHWPQGSDGSGALLSGDILQVVPDRRHVSFMWSYPNYIPLPAFTLRDMSKRLEPFDYDTVFGGFWDAEITQDGKAAVNESFRRYLAMLERGTLD
jgi:glyoxylase-like metal-dependent hydrolase (beta-lactamase superfamily II)